MAVNAGDSLAQGNTDYPDTTTTPPPPGADSKPAEMGDPKDTEENRAKLAQYGVFKGPEGFYNKNGQPMKDENGEPVTTVDAAMKEVNKDYPGAFPEAAGGPGGPGGAGGEQGPPAPIATA